MNKKGKITMANYPLIPQNEERTLFSCMNAGYSDEYASRVCDLYVSSEVHDMGHGKLQKFYRLHAKQPHSIEMALRYEIQCPKCYHPMQKVSRCNDYHDLGLYTCPTCEKK